MKDAHTSKAHSANELNNIDAELNVLEEGLSEHKKTAEELQELRESKERYRILTEQALVGVYIYCESDRRYLFVNRAFMEITGYSRDELMTMNPNEDLVLPQDRWILEKRGEAHQRGEKISIEYTLRIKRKNGEIAHVMTQMHPIIYDKREAYLGHSIDITERKRAEEIQRLQYHIANAVLTTKDFDSLYTLIHKELGNVMDVSNFAIALYDKKTDRVSLPYYVDEKDELGTFPARKTLTAHVIRNAKPLLATWREVQKLVRAAEVEVVGTPSKVWLGVPLVIRGEVIGAIVVQNYVDEKALGDRELEILKFVSSQIGLSIERRRTEEALRKSLQRNEAILQAVPDMMFILSRDGTFVDFKAERDEDLIVPRSEIIGKNIHESGFPEDYVSLIEDRVKKALDNMKPQALDYELKTPKGPSSYEARIVPLSENEVVAVVRDITRRKRVEGELKLSLQRLHETIESTLRAMAQILETRDPYTAGHQQRVATLTLAIGNEMNLPQDQIQGLHIAALIHDIGKIYVPAEILSRPTMLTESEFALLKTHPEVGYKILRNIQFKWPIAEIILQHHERLDGSGYPRGLKNGEIMLEARILAVADVVEAMQSHRPYRPTRGLKTTLEEISQNKVILYDPDVVDACLRLFNEKGFKFEID